MSILRKCFLIAFLTFLSIVIQPAVMHADSLIDGNDVELNDAIIWMPGESILVQIHYNKKVYPVDYIIGKGEFVSGNVISMYANDSDYLLIKVDDIDYFEMYIFFNVRGEGWLKAYACYDAYLTSSPDTPSTVDFTRLNISVFNTISQTFDYLGPANGTPYWIDDRYISGDQRLLVKVHGEGDASPYIFFMARISYAYYSLAPEYETVLSQYMYTDDTTVLHKVELSIYYSNATVTFINISRWWHFLYSQPHIDWYYPNRSFIAVNKGTYTLFFMSKNYWNYPWKKLTKVILVDTRGQYIPFDLFDIYYRIIETRKVEAQNFLFQRNITIRNPYNITLCNYPVLLILNDTIFNFFAVNPDLSDIMFCYPDHEVSPQIYYIDYWDGKKARIWIRPTIIRGGMSNISMLYGSDYNSTNQSAAAKSLSVIHKDFYYPEEIEGWLNSDGQWIVLTTIYSDTDELYHGKASHHAYIVSDMNYSALVNIKTLLTGFSFATDYSVVYVGTYLLYVDENNYVALEILKDETGAGYIRLYQKMGNSTIVTQNSTIEIDYISDLAKVDVEADLDYFNKTIIVNLTVYKNPTGTYHYLMKLNNNALLAGGRVGFYCANTSLSIDYVYVDYENLTTMKGLAPEIVAIGDEDVYAGGLVIHYMVGNYERMYTNYIDVPTDVMLNIIVKDLFGNVIANVTTQPVETIVIPLKVHSLKIKNNRDDIFVHITLMKDNGFFNWTEWLAPHECTEFILYPGNYQLEILYAGNMSQTAVINFSLMDDIYIMINGTVLGDVLMELQRVNSTLINQIQHIDLYVSNINNTVGNLSINLRIHIENLNSTLTSLMTNLQINITNLYSSINSSIINLASTINDTNALIRDLNISIINELESMNVSINKIMLDFSNNMSLIYTSIGVLRENISANLQLLNSSITSIINDLTHKLFMMNSTISNIMIDLESKLITVNSSLGTMILNLTNEIIQINSSINAILLGIINELASYNSTLSQIISNITNIFKFEKTTLYSTIWDLKNDLIMINTSLWNLFVDLENYLIVLNTSIDSFMANLQEGIIMLNTQIQLLNQTILVTLYDMQMNLTRTILISLDEINNLSQILYSLVNIFKITLYNKYSGERLNLGLFRVLVNGTAVPDNTIATVAQYLDVEVRDYWNRTIWRNVTDQRDIKIYLNVGKLLILNEKRASVVVLISPENISDPLTIIVPPMESYSLDLYAATKYNITVLEDNEVLLSGVYEFAERQNNEPIILIKVSETEVIMIQQSQQNDITTMFLSFLSGIGISALSTGIYKLFFARRFIVKADELLRQIMTNEEARASLLALTRSEEEHSEE